MRCGLLLCLLLGVDVAVCSEPASKPSFWQRVLRPQPRDLSDKPPGKYPNTFTNYGTFCGPGPGLHADCSVPTHLQPIDAVDSFCALHDQAYCKCGHAALRAAREKPKRVVTEKERNTGAEGSGCKKLPSTVMLALRSRIAPKVVSRRILRHYGQYFEHEEDQRRVALAMVRCIHAADSAFAQRCATLRDRKVRRLRSEQPLLLRQALPLWWDDITRWKYHTMIRVFEGASRAVPVVGMMWSENVVSFVENLQSDARLQIVLTTAAVEDSPWTRIPQFWFWRRRAPEP
eukprot:scaffold1424_cov237-Pinguiococcus_pyrenoidosus.AAC.11